jgi:outer membrane protein TolC
MSFNGLSLSQVRPKLQAFVQLGYANPGLNFLKNEFATYYIAGVKFNWSISSFYTRNNTNRIQLLNKNMAELQKETFRFNTELNLIQQQQELSKYDKLISADQQLVDLRSKIKNAAKAQWDNGVITVSDYLRELNAEDQARTNQALHQIQYLQALYLYNYYSGN